MSRNRLYLRRACDPDIRASFHRHCSIHQSCSANPFPQDNFPQSKDVSTTPTFDPELLDWLTPHEDLAAPFFSDTFLFSAFTFHLFAFPSRVSDTGLLDRLPLSRRTQFSDGVRVGLRVGDCPARARQPCRHFIKTSMA